MDTIGKKLEAYRLKSNLSQTEVAGILGIPVLDYIAIEEGKVDITVTDMLKLCNHYGLKPEELLSEEPRVLETDVDTDSESEPFERPEPESRYKPGDTVLPPTSTARTAKEDEEHFLDLVAEVIVKIILTEEADKRKLKKSPGGYHFDKDRKVPCPICRKVVSGKDTWYDRNGVKCILCQNAIDKRIIPASLVKTKDSFYTEYELGEYFCLKGKSLDRWKEGGLIRSRTIPGKDGKGKHFELFLLTDNKGFLPPKKKLQKLGSPWYQYVADPLEYLKNYGISKYLRVEIRQPKGQPPHDAAVPDSPK